MKGTINAYQLSHVLRNKLDTTSASQDTLALFTAYVLFIVMLLNVTSGLSGYISEMNYSRQESHNRDIVPHSFRMIGDGL